MAESSPELTKRMKQRIKRDERHENRRQLRICAEYLLNKPPAVIPHDLHIPICQYIVEERLKDPDIRAFFPRLISDYDALWGFLSLLMGPFRYQAQLKVYALRLALPHLQVLAGFNLTINTRKYDVNASLDLRKHDGCFGHPIQSFSGNAPFPRFCRQYITHLYIELRLPKECFREFDCRMLTSKSARVQMEGLPKKLALLKTADGFTRLTKLTVLLHEDYDCEDGDPQLDLVWATPIQNGQEILRGLITAMRTFDGKRRIVLLLEKQSGMGGWDDAEDGFDMTANSDKCVQDFLGKGFAVEKPVWF